MSTTTSARGRGRPRAGDPQAISEVAFALIRERGYAATTMADIARAAGISAPTLFRYFPSKAAVLWYGWDDSAALFRDALGSVASTGLVDAIFEAYLAMLAGSPVRLAVIKHRIAIVTRGPEATDAAWERYETWGRIVTEFVAARRGLPADSLEAVVEGGMIWSALWSAITVWALGPDDVAPETAVRAARRLVVIPE